MTRERKGSWLEQCLPEEFWEHRRAARREQLMACRSLFDAAIEGLERKPSEEEKAARPGRRLRELLPEPFWDHLRAARREKLLSYRSLLDVLIERQEKKGPTKAARIEVES